MVVLEHPRLGLRHQLYRSGLIGRSRDCVLRLGSGVASGEHAALRWSGEDWEIRDLSSRNGTFVDGVRLEAGQRATLRPGLKLGFGQANDPWTVVEVLPAPPSARCGELERHGEGGMLLLPDEGSAEVCVVADGAGWRAEAGDREWAVLDGQEVEAGGQRWRLDLPVVLAPTREAGGRTLGEAHLTLRVSRDEEHIEGILRCGGQEFSLAHRAHAYLVLTLARARLTAEPGLPASEQGWVYQDELARSLGLGPTHFNVAIHRAREQVRQAGFSDADTLIERRRGAGQLRLGVGSVEVGGL